MFHKACLRTWCARGAARCPHCNTRKWALRGVLHKLLAFGEGDCWTRGPACATMRRGRIECERRLMCHAVRVVMEAMRLRPIRVRIVDETLTRFTCALGGHRELEVGLQRTAWVGHGGRILRDGFEITAVRRRVSGRCTPR